MKWRNFVPSKNHSKLIIMYRENLTERDIPYEILEKHGLTHEMIDDLPQSVMNKLLHGEYTPLLPITMKTDMGEWQYLSRISLTTTNNGVKVVMKPKIESSSIGLYSPEQQELLKQGKTIIGQRPKDLRNNENTGKYFIQYDEDINQVLSVPTSAVGENIRVLSDMLGLDYESIKNIQQGEPQTVEWMDEEANDEVQMLTFGIDLRRDLGIRFAVGDLNEWLGQAKDFKDKYNFGLYGVWIASEDGKSGRYVPESEYTDEIREQMELARKRNRDSAQESLKM